MQDAGERETKSEGVVRTYYYCHRSVIGHDSRLVSKKDRQRLIKSIGSNKINATCPSTMTVTKSHNSINVKYYSTHVGHDLKICRKVIPKEDKDLIAGEYIIKCNLQYAAFHFLFVH